MPKSIREIERELRAAEEIAAVVRRNRGYGRQLRAARGPGAPREPYYRGLIRRAQMKLAEAWWSGDLGAVEAAVADLQALAPRDGREARDGLGEFRRLTGRGD